MIYICLRGIEHEWIVLSDVYEDKRGEPTYFLPSANTTVHLVQQSPPDHLEQNNAGARIKHLLAGRAIAFILHICLFTLCGSYIGSVNTPQRLFVLIVRSVMSKLFVTILTLQ